MGDRGGPQEARDGTGQQLARRLLARLSDESFGLVQGSTDTEHIFALFADHYRRANSEPSFHGGSGGVGALSRADTPSGPMMADRTEAIRSALEATIADIETLRRECEIQDAASLNLAVTDGYSAVVTRYVSHHPQTANTLYVCQGEAYTSDDGGWRMKPRAEEGNHAVLVASEPLSEHQAWDPVPPNHAVSVDSRLRVHVLPIERTGR